MHSEKIFKVPSASRNHPKKPALVKPAASVQESLPVCLPILFPLPSPATPRAARKGPLSPIPPRLTLGKEQGGEGTVSPSFKGRRRSEARPLTNWHHNHRQRRRPEMLLLPRFSRTNFLPEKGRREDNPSSYPDIHARPTLGRNDEAKLISHNRRPTAHLPACPPSLRPSVAPGMIN